MKIKIKNSFMQIIVLVVLLTFSLFLFSACDEKHKGIILFNSVPINQNNALHNKKVFSTGQKIYYLFVAQQKMTDDFIRIQVFKITDKAALGGYDVVRTKDYRLMKDERYYHTDYFVLHEKGRYAMQVFAHSDFTTPVAISEFYVEQ